MARKSTGTRIAWNIRDFPERLKNRFMGICKAEGLNWKDQLRSAMETKLTQIKKERSH